MRQHGSVRACTLPTLTAMDCCETKEWEVDGAGGGGGGGCQQSGS